MDNFKRYYTQIIREYVPNETYQGRHTIHSESRIQNGVLYNPGTTGEACVVDFSEDPYLNDLYDEVIEVNHNHRNITDSNVVDKKYILEDVFNVIKDRIPYDYEYIMNNFQNEYIGKKITITLGAYIQSRGGKGVCRHMALASSAILEKMIDQGMLNGSVKYRSNVKNDKDGHAWTEYTTSSGEVGIIDVAQQYYGYLGECETWNHEV